MFVLHVRNLYFTTRSSYIAPCKQYVLNLLYTTIYISAIYYCVIYFTVQVAPQIALYFVFTLSVRFMELLELYMCAYTIQFDMCVLQEYLSYLLCLYVLLLSIHMRIGN